MRDQELDEIKARCEAATEGPWFVEDFGNRDEYSIGYGEPHPSLNRRNTLFSGEPTEAQGLNKNDADFIAHTRTDIPALLDEVQRLRARVT